jgi:ankyrin repeat protein
MKEDTMSNDPGSPILAALYNQKRDEAERLADAAPELSVWEAAALGRNDRLSDLLSTDPAAAASCAVDGFFPLSLAAFFAPAATVKLLLDAGADVSAASRNAMRVQALHAAVGQRRADTVALLLNRGADPNARQQVGYTALMAAAGAGREDIVSLLLSHGADPSLVSEDGKTAAILAREHGHADLAVKVAEDGMRSPR